MISRLIRKFNVKPGFALVCQVVLFFPALAAQPPVNTEAFFQRLPASELTPPGGGVVKMPWFESYEFRTETRDFDLDQQEYTFRLSPSTRRKVRAQEGLYRHLENAPDFKAEDDRCQVLADRYTDWVEMYFLSREADLLVALEKVRADQSTVLNRLAGTLDFDWSELISIREEQTELQVETVFVMGRKEYFLGQYGLVGASLDFGDLITLDEIRERIQKTNSVATDPEIAYELETISRELELERAEQKQYLDFAQVRYQGPHDDPARERLSVGVALQLPNSGNQLIKIREMELEAASLRQEQSRELAAGQSGFEARRQQLTERFRRYDTFAGLYLREREEFKGLSRKMAGKDGVNPLPILKIRDRALRNDLKLLRLQAELYDDYLGLMERNGEVCKSERGEVLR